MKTIRNTLFLWLLVAGTVAAQGEMRDQESRPVPDPTLLTTQALEREVAALKSMFKSELEAQERLFIEKIRRIDTQISERDTTARERSLSVKEEVQNALKAAEDAVEKSREAITKQIDGIDARLENDRKTKDEKIDELKERLTIIEGRAQGVGDGWGVIVGGAGMLFAFLTLMALVIGMFTRGSTAKQ